MTLMENIIHECQKLLVEHGLYGRGTKKRLAAEIGCSYGSLVMALSGYRTGKASTEILNRIIGHLNEKP